MWLADIIPFLRKVSFPRKRESLLLEDIPAS